MNQATHSPLIEAHALAARLQDAEPPVLLDCSFDLSDTEKGSRTYAQGHLPGAHYVHLDRDLSGPKHPEGPRSARFTGRHPLPERQAFAAWAAQRGVRPGRLVVAYDGDGLPFAARAWWLLRWLGHSQVAVLDGGTAAWVAAGYALSTDVPPLVSAPAYPASAEPAMPTIDAPQLLAKLGEVAIVDARAAERFRGDVEPLDPVGGHIPGARQRFFKDNLAPDGRFQSAQALRDAFAQRGVHNAQGVVMQCGSGVTACHNLLAMAHAGLGEAVLYPGSWSQWCADPTRPVARGD